MIFRKNNNNVLASQKKNFFLFFKKVDGFLPVILIFCLFIQSAGAAPAIYFKAGKKSDTYDYVIRELNTFLKPDFSIIDDKNSAQWIILPDTDSELSEGSFCVSCNKEGKQNIIHLTGNNETSMLQAVYTFLEKAGMRFEITGPVKITTLSFENLKGTADTINPLVKQRGIRQHLNFPMDISSYPLEEAKEYIHNLARLRFNYIVFHSYPGQWYEVHRPDTTEYAGLFFYGQTYSIPGDSLLHNKIRNRKVFCIPEIEPFYDQSREKSTKAIEWLQEVMKECKRVGLKIRFSFEPRSISSDVSKTLETAKAILEYYPLIDELELMTEETGGWGPRCSRQQTENILKEHFGKEILNETLVTAAITDNSEIGTLYGQIGHNIKAGKIINDSLIVPGGIKEALGLYITIPKYLGGAYYLLKRFAPEALYSILPAHGARKVDLYLPYANMTRNDWKKTMIYSWCEFDGIMYLQQNEVRGIRRLIEYGEDINKQNGVQSICYNHWRTAENRVPIRYAAVSGMSGAQDESMFYADYAKTYGIKDISAFYRAMRKIDDAAWYATTELPNVGFCYAGVWGKKFGYFGRMNRDKLNICEKMYAEALEFIRECTIGVENRAGQNLLTFFDNRLRATIIYLKAFEKGTELQEYNRQLNLSEEEKQRVADICNQSILMFEQYMQVHAGMVVDRRCEGTLISVYHTPIAVLKRIRNEFGNIPYDEKPVSKGNIDSPPPPISF